MTFDFTGPSDRWFGVAWGGHSSGDAFIYTTGFNDDSTLDGHDCHLHEEETDATTNDIDTEENWVILSLTDDGSEVNIIATRVLDTGENSEDQAFSFPPNVETYYFAHGQDGSDHALGYHGTWKTSLSIDLESGVSSVVDETEFNLEDHALFMTLSFAIFIPIGGLLNRYLGFSICGSIGILRRYSYLGNQLHKCCMIIGYVFAMWGWFTKWADNKEWNFDTAHTVMGFLMILCLNFMIFGVLFANVKLGIIQPLYFTGKGKGDVQATNGHRYFGMFFILFGLFVALLGYNLGYGADSDEISGYIAWIVILIAVWFILEVYGRLNKESMNKQERFNNANRDDGSDLPIIFDGSGARAQLIDNNSNANANAANDGQTKTTQTTVKTDNQQVQEERAKVKQVKTSNDGNNLMPTSSTKMVAVGTASHTIDDTGIDGNVTDDNNATDGDIDDNNDDNNNDTNEDEAVTDVNRIQSSDL